ncbi:MAG: hypothetical protein PWP43_632, partial [Bacillota bacterium]|nr:hypothetical protein [Bacillota bacterium]
MGGRLKPGRWDRLARWVPLLVLLLAGLVAQVLLHGPAARLGLARRLLLPFVLLAAAALWPGLLHPPEPEKDTGSRKILALLLSLITVPLVLLAVPLWYGHGCWAPDLYSFLLYLAAGEVLVFLVPWGRRLLGRWPAEQRGSAAMAFFSAFLLAGLSAWLASPPVRKPIPPAGDVPAPAWRVTPWQATWAAWAPLPWSRADYAPADPAVDAGRVVFLDLPGRVNVLQAEDGGRLATLALPAPQRLLPGDTARGCWERPLGAAGHFLLRRRGGSELKLLDPAEWTLRHLPGEAALAAAPAPDGFYILRPQALERLSADGDLLWSCSPDFPPVPPGPMEPPWLEVNPFLQESFSSRLVPGPRLVFCLSFEGLYAVDGATGRLLWQKEASGRCAGMAVAPDHSMVYIAEVEQAGSRLRAFRADGGTAWQRTLPQNCRALSWAAGPGGLLVALRAPEAAPAEFIGDDGAVRYTLPLPASEPFTLQYLDGLFLVACGSGVRAHRASDGALLWETGQEKEPGAAGHFRYYET